MNAVPKWLLVGIIPLVLLASCNTPHKINYPDLSYQISPTTLDEKSALAVTLDFDIQKAGPWNLVVPHHWANQKTLFNAIKNLHVNVNKKEIFSCDFIDNVEDGVLKNFDGKSHDHVTISYTVVGLVEKIDQKNRFQQTIFPRYFHVIGYGLFVFPAWAKKEKEYEKPFNLTLRWENIPNGHIIANSFGCNEKTQKIAAITIDKMRDAIYIGGNLRALQFICHSKPVYIVLYGDLPIRDHEIVEKAQKVVTSQREFWADFDFPYYLISAIPYQGKGFSGTGLTHTFCMWLSDSEKTSNISFVHLLSHEHFHTWNAGVITFESGEKDSWFKEGFTDYYAYLLNLRCGLISLTEYLNNYNQVVSLYSISPVKNASNQEIVNLFWDKPDLKLLPYQRGFLLAHHWNNLIIQETNSVYSLDDVMKELLKIAKREHKKFSTELLRQAFKKFCTHNIQADIDRFIERGETITPLSTSITLGMDPRSRGHGPKAEDDIDRAFQTHKTHVK